MSHNDAVYAICEELNKAAAAAAKAGDKALMRKFLGMLNSEALALEVAPKPKSTLNYKNIVARGNDAENALLIRAEHATMDY